MSSFTYFNPFYCCHLQKTSSQALKSRYGSQRLGGSSLSMGRSRASLNKSQLLPMMMLDQKADIEMKVLKKVRNVSAC